jgi:hypothetical protein
MRRILSFYGLRVIVISSDTYLQVRQPVFVLGLFVLTLTFGVVMAWVIVGNRVLEEKFTSL